jgi:hypothetical protein
LANKFGEVIEDKKIKLDGNLGREIQIAAPNNSLYRERIYRVKDDQLYRIFVLGPKDTVKSADLDKFLDSFKLTAK